MQNHNIIIFPSREWFMNYECWSPAEKMSKPSKDCTKHVQKVSRALVCRQCNQQVNWSDAISIDSLKEQRMLFPFNSFPSRNSKVKIPKLSLVKISYLPFCFILSANVNDILVSGNKQFHLQNKKLKTAVAFIQFTADNELSAVCCVPT